jgi:hypothetical protein
MTTIKLQGHSHPIFSAIILIVLALVILLGLPDKALGQGQWTSSGADISNTNTGNVGIGTTTPGDLLELRRSQNGGTMIRLDNPDSVSPSAYSGITFYQNGVRRSHVVSVNDGCGGCIGGAGAMQIYNFANTHMIFATNSAERMRITNAGNIGLGTTSPDERLTIIGNLHARSAGGTDGHVWLQSGSSSNIEFDDAGSGTNRAVAFGANVPGQTLSSNNANLYFSSFTSGAWNPRMTILNAGNVGIGTTTPAYRFDVQGGALNASGGLCIAGDCRTSWSQVGGGAGSSQWTTSGTNIFYNSGNVGIGTTTPATSLHARKTLVGADSEVLRLENGDSSAFSGAYQSFFFGSYEGARILAKNNNDGFFNLRFYTYNAYSGGLAEKMALLGNGNLGIGTTNPVSRLHVYNSGSNTRSGVSIDSQGTQSVQQAEINLFTLGDGTKDVATAGTKGWHLAARGNSYLGTPEQNDLQLYSWNGTDIVIRQYWDSNGNVGIGTTNPTNLLQINSGNAPATGQFRLSANNAGSLSGIAYSPNNVALGFDVDYANGSWIARDNSVAWLYKTSSKFFLQGSTSNAVGGVAAANSYLAVDLSNGNVGIGTTTPTTKLHVAGDITVTGNINAKYQDVAEWVPATHALPAGTVVVLNPTQSNQVMASANAYDTRVAGVISERPGLTLGEAGADKVLVATTGRVKVKVDATRAPIQVGDLLVTSEREGTAMKSMPLDLGGTPIHRPGTLIGKALEPLEKGTGEILVLLSLQ